jgi:hypothetical protein
MGHNYSSTYGELTLEPMEGDTLGDRIFGDFSSRDRNPSADAASTSESCKAVGAKPQNATDSGSVRKPAGKANFLTDDRANPDRRCADRRSTVRLTGDRRESQSRRDKTNAWEQEFRA